MSLLRENDGRTGMRGRRADPSASGLILYLASGLLAAGPAAAHGLGQRYDLPLPLSLYVMGAGATVALSFLVAVLFLRAATSSRDYPRRVLRPRAPLRSGMRAVATASRALAAALFVLVVAAGFFGEQNQMRNILPLAVWIVWWVGIAFASALIGDVYRFLDPWDTLFAWFERIAPRTGRLAYPAWLGTWPAFVLLLAFAWMELVWSGREVPAQLATAALAYSALTWLGMFLFGRETWRAHGEVFAVVFGLLARFAPLRIGAAREEGIELRPYAVGLLEDTPIAPSMMALAVLLLATVSFDGFLETPLWAQVDWHLLNAPADAFIWSTLDLSEIQALRIARTLGLLAFALGFLGVYVLFCRLMAAMTAGAGGGAGALARRFVLSLVPIAVAYHIAHYFSFLALGLQGLIPLLSDPLGRGWNLFGGAAFQVDAGLVGPRLQWYVAVGSVVIGHILAVYLAHVTALGVFRERRAALLSQIPMLVLMVGYTMLSLWILSQPIVETGAGG
jgi:hypothetical protein